MSIDMSHLGDLADPHRFRDPLHVEGRDAELLKAQMRTMLIIRKAEERIGDMVAAGKIKCPCHLGIGQEAIAVGISEHLRRTDRVFGAHRSHTHFLALNEDVFGLFAEVLGRQDGCSKGMGGSMHLYGRDSGFVGSVPIVGATVPIAAGAALAAKMDARGNIAVSYFGDGATEEGAFHETMNMASVMKLPIVFICENNLFSSHMHITQRQPADSTGRYARGYEIPFQVIDGNDLTAVSSAARQAVERAREGQGPYFIEAVTYRWRGHVGPREDLDVGLQRNEDLVEWKKRDPIERLFLALQGAGKMDGKEYEEMQKKVDDLISRTWERAENSPYPDESALLECVYPYSGEK